MFKPSSMGKEGKKIGVTLRQILTGPRPQVADDAVVIQDTSGCLSNVPNLAVDLWPACKRQRLLARRVPEPPNHDAGLQLTSSSAMAENLRTASTVSNPT